jgi:hypothetical protein
MASAAGIPCLDLIDIGKYSRAKPEMRSLRTLHDASRYPTHHHDEAIYRVPLGALRLPLRLVDFGTHLAYAL